MVSRVWLDSIAHTSDSRFGIAGGVLDMPHLDKGGSSLPHTVPFRRQPLLLPVYHDIEQFTYGIPWLAPL